MDTLSITKKTALTGSCILAGLLVFSLTAFAQESVSTSSNSAAPRAATSSEETRDRQELRETSLETRQENTATRTEAVEERQADRAERVMERQDLRQVRQVALQAVRQERVLNLSANISNRMEAAIERLYSIIERLEGRIAKIRENGMDTRAAETRLREAAQLLAEAKTALNDIDNQVYMATTSTEPQAKWHTVRETYLEAGRLIRASHQALRDTVALLKTAPRETAAGTVSTSSTITQ